MVTYFDKCSHVGGPYVALIKHNGVAKLYVPGADFGKTCLDLQDLERLIKGAQELLVDIHGYWVVTEKSKRSDDSYDYFIIERGGKRMEVSCRKHLEVKEGDKVQLNYGNHEIVHIFMN